MSKIVGPGARDEERVGFVRLLPPRVIGARQALGLSREALAERAAGDISEATIKRAEGGRPVSLAKARALATLLTCDLTSLLDDRRPREPDAARSGKATDPRERSSSRNSFDSEPITNDELVHYQQVCEGEHGSLVLAGLVTSLRVPLDLEALYVPLHGLVDLRGYGDAEFADASEAEARLAERTREIPLLVAFREAEERGCRALVILGDPGSGKTTHLKRIALYCLREGSQALGLPRDLLPIVLPIRDLGRATDLESFVEAQLLALNAFNTPGIGKRLLERGRLLLLFDGLDEVADEREDSARSKSEFASSPRSRAAARRRVDRALMFPRTSLCSA